LGDDVQEPGEGCDFYKKIFGWKITPHPEIGYNVAETEGRAASTEAFSSPTARVLAALLTMYILVDELAPYRKKIVARAQDPRRGAGGAQHGLAHAVYRSGRPHDGLWKAKMK